LNGKKFTKKHTLKGSIGYSLDKRNYYGQYVNTALFSPESTIYDDQTYSRINAGIGLENTTTDSTDINYKLSLRFNTLADDYSAKEDNFVWNSLFKTRLDNGLLGLLAVDVDHNDYESKFITNAEIANATTIVRLHPYVRAGNEYWQAFVGPSFSVMTGDISETLFNLIGEIKFNLIDEILIPYAGAKGGIERNNLQKSTSENPFVISNLELLSSKNKYQIYGGIRGSFSSKIAFNASLSNSSIDDAPFYSSNLYLPSFFSNESNFSVIYDDISLTQLKGELSYQNKEKIKLFLIGEYFSYQTDKLPEPLYKPNYKITLTGQYDLRDKIIVKLDLFGIGEQYAESLVNVDLETNELNVVIVRSLKGIIDANLGLEYRYTKKVSAFLNFNNIGSVRYERWANYPTQRFSLLGGLKFSF